MLLKEVLEGRGTNTILGVSWKNRVKTKKENSVVKFRALFNLSKLGKKNWRNFFDFLFLGLHCKFFDFLSLSRLSFFLFCFFEERKRKKARK